MKKTLLFLTSFFLFFGLAWSQKWHVCLGSYSIEKNAQAFQAELESAGYPAFIQKSKTNDSLLYRVLLAEEYEDADQARKKCRDFEENSFSLRHKLKGLWILNAGSSDSVPAINNKPAKTEAPVVLKKNAEIPVSKEKPYSVHIQTYREEQAAENDRKRLAEKEVDAFVLKKLDKQKSISFDLQAGAFEKPEEANVLVEKLESLELTNLEVTDYNDYADQVSEFDDVITQREIRYDNGIYELPDSIPASVKTCLNQFPVNENFQIREVEIYDIANMKKHDKTDGLDFMRNHLNEVSTENVSAISYAEYIDDLFGKEISILIATADEPDFSNFIEEEQKQNIFLETDFILPYGKLHSFISSFNSGYMIQGTTEDSRLFVKMIMPEFSKEEMISFVENSYSDSSLLFYPQIRKNLCVIPDLDGIDRSFISFKLSKVDETYARERSYSDWSLEIVGHWESYFTFIQNNENFSTSLFDLDYDYNAEKVHNMYMTAKKEFNENDGNHFEPVKDKSGWFVSNFLLGNELSFSQKSYIIAVDSEYGSSLKVNELKSLAEQLKIWY